MQKSGWDHTLRACWLLTIGCVLTTFAAATADFAQPQLTPDGPVYRISQFEVGFIHDHPQHPTLHDLMAVTVELGQLATGYVRPREDVPTVKLQLGDLDGRDVRRFHASGLQVVLEGLRDALVARDLMGVYVAPHVRDIDEVGRDLRPLQRNDLRLTITTGVVTELRTLAAGERIAPADRIDHPLHRRIRQNSPVRPYDEGDPEQRDLLQRELLDRYVYHLGRHPGRRVDLAVAAAEEPGTVALDYFVTENRPLVLYFQAANTGTRQTGRWRQRFGLIHNQLTNNDDILNLDFTTASFDRSHAFMGSYEAPVGRNDRLRWSVYGNWQRFTASDVGFFDAEFRGESWGVGGEIRPNIFQHRDLFVDAVAGVRYEDIDVETRLFDIPIVDGQQDFLYPYVGLRLERDTTWYSTRAAVMFEFQRGSLTSVDHDELDELGRTAPDRNWEVLRWNMLHSFFLEPVLDHDAWRDPQTAETSTLAHEVAFGLRGQYAFNNRLIPQAQQTAGGLYTVRGYPESITAGDTVIIGSAEYRFHLPRIFGIEPEPRQLLGQPFRFAPQQVYGRPDWNLIGRAFVDAARTINSRRLAFERDETLVGTGVGVELLVRRNLNVRLDWGVALSGVREGEVRAGSNRVHFVATLIY